MGDTRSYHQECPAEPGGGAMTKGEMMETKLVTVVTKTYTIQAPREFRDNAVFFGPPLVQIRTENGRPTSLRIHVDEKSETFLLPCKKGIAILEFIREALADIIVEIQIDNDPERVGKDK